MIRTILCGKIERVCKKPHLRSLAFVGCLDDQCSRLAIENNHCVAVGLAPGYTNTPADKEGQDDGERYGFWEIMGKAMEEVVLELGNPNKMGRGGASIKSHHRASCDGPCFLMNIAR